MAIRWTRSINRYYDPTTDQFLSVDPMVDQTGQPYVFTNDNPLNSTDPLGQGPILILESALAAETVDDWNPTGWIASGVTLIAIGGYEGYHAATRIFTKASPTVADILKGKKGSIKNAPLPKGSPSWKEIQGMTQQEINQGAAENRPGYRAIKKLLTDRRFNK